MTTSRIQFFPSWPYDEALLWMNNAHILVSAMNNVVVIGCGSHQEPVITIGKHHKKTNEKEQAHILVRHIDRGGGITAHEPGQIVLYPVFNIKEHKLSVVQLISLMEKTIFDFIGSFGLSGHRSLKGPGVYISEQKIGFVGLRIKDYITSHGLSVNVKNDAAIFKIIQPCGVKDLAITSLKDHVTLDEPIDAYMRLLVTSFLRNFALF